MVASPKPALVQEHHWIRQLLDARGVRCDGGGDLVMVKSVVVKVEEALVHIPVRCCIYFRAHACLTTAEC
jgi:hypothetical protein